MGADGFVVECGSVCVRVCVVYGSLGVDQRTGMCLGLNSMCACVC